MADERIADHRPAYLDYEGAVSDKRGTVRRVAWGTVVSEHRQGSSWDFEIRWEDRGDGMSIRQRLRLAPLEDGGAAWEAVCEAAEATDG